MLGQSSDFAPVDLLASLGMNAVSTHFACKSETFRLGYKNKQGEIPAWADVRFLGGLAAAVAAQFGGPNVARVGHDAALGLLNSYVATETCRKHAIDRLKAAGGASAAPAAIPEAVPTAGGKNAYAYDEGSANAGW